MLAPGIAQQACKQTAYITSTHATSPCLASRKSKTGLVNASLWSSPHPWQQHGRFQNRTGRGDGRNNKTDVTCPCRQDRPDISAFSFPCKMFPLARILNCPELVGPSVVRTTFLSDGVRSAGGGGVAPKGARTGVVAQSPLGGSTQKTNTRTFNQMFAGP
eukprot:2698080-Rhodomonas_salina.1